MGKPKTFSTSPKGKWRTQSESIFQNGRTRNLQNEGRRKLRPWRKKKITGVTNNRLRRWRKKKLGGKSNLGMEKSQTVIHFSHHFHSALSPYFSHFCNFALSLSPWFSHFCNSFNHPFSLLLNHSTWKCKNKKFNNKISLSRQVIR